MTNKNIYVVNDNGEPTYIIAESMAEAVTKWRKHTAEGNTGLDEGDPESISIVADSSSVIE